MTWEFDNLIACEQSNDVIIKAKIFDIIRSFYISLKN